MVTRLFSFRYRKQLEQGDEAFHIVLTPRLRGRIWAEMNDADGDVQKSDETGYNWNTSVLSEVESTLCRLYGHGTLIASHPSNGRADQVKLLALNGRPFEVFDAVEAVWEEAWESKRMQFQERINTAFTDEGCGWRLCEGAFFKVDAEFMESVLEHAHAVLRTDGFAGAQQEFLDARSELTGGEAKDAILKACNSMESVLKVLTGQQSGAASDLTKRLLSTGHLNDLPDAKRKAITSAVLPALAVLRNELGGHGQGADIIDVPKHYGRLAVNLAGAFNTFLIDKHLELRPPAPKKDADDLGVPQIGADDEIPF